MDWTRLDLRKASVLRKEVDLAVRLLNRAASLDTEEGSSELQLLLESAQNRIREIEEFYTANDDDERSILFEKQRLRLRRAVQSVTTSAGVVAKPKHEAGPSKQDNTSIKTAIATPHAEPHGEYDYQTPRAKPRPLVPRGSAAAGTSARSPRSAVKTPRSPGSVISAASQPIYAWELATHNAGEAANTVRERITTDSASFIPSNDMGVYVCDSNESYGGGDSNDLIDFQVVLSAEEFQVYVSRLRNAVAEKKHSERFIDHKKTAAEKASLLSSTPYVDPKRIQNELLRPAQPHKWVGDGAGFRPTGSKIQ